MPELVVPVIASSKVTLYPSLARSVTVPKLWIPLDAPFALLSVNETSLLAADMVIVPAEALYIAPPNAEPLEDST